MTSQSKASRIGGALFDLAVLGVFIAIGVEGGRWLAHLNVAADPHARHWLHLHRPDLVARQAAMLTATFAYLFAAILAGTGFLIRRLPQRVMLPLGSPVAWIVLLFLGSIVGLVVLPVLVLWRPLQLILAFAHKPAPPVALTVNVPPTRVYLVDRRGEVAQHLDADEHGYIEADAPSRPSIAG